MEKKSDCCGAEIKKGEGDTHPDELPSDLGMSEQPPNCTHNTPNQI